MRNRRRNEYETRIISDAKFRIVRFASIGCNPLTVDRLVCADESQHFRVIYQVRSSQLACRKHDSMNRTSVTDRKFNLGSE